MAAINPRAAVAGLRSVVGGLGAAPPAHARSPPAKRPTANPRSGQPKRSRRLGVRISEELRAPLPLLVLPDLPSSPSQGGKRPQKPLVGPVVPRNRPKPLPPSPPQLVQPTVVPSPRIRVSSNRVPGVQRALSQQRPSLRKVGIGPHDLARVSATVRGGLRLRAFGKSSRLGPEEVLMHAAIVPHISGSGDEHPHDSGHNGQHQCGDEHSGDDLLAHGRALCRAGPSRSTPLTRSCIRIGNIRVKPG
jgi:hypothetical protein